MHSRYLRIENLLANARAAKAARPLHRRWTLKERLQWQAGAQAQANGMPRSANPHTDDDGDLAEVLEVAWFKGWDDTAAQDMSPIRELCGGEGGGA